MFLCGLIEVSVNTFMDIYKQFDYQTARRLTVYTGDIQEKM